MLFHGLYNCMTFLIGVICLMGHRVLYVYVQEFHDMSYYANVCIELQNTQSLGARKSTIMMAMVIFPSIFGLQTNNKYNLHQTQVLGFCNDFNYSAKSVHL